MFDFISINGCRLLVQTLGHSLWQASLIAIACWLVLRTLPARRTSLRYGVACGGLLAVIVSVLSTMTVLNEPASQQPVQLSEHSRIRAFDNPQTIEWFNETVAESDLREHEPSPTDSLPASEPRRDLASMPSIVPSPNQPGLAWSTVLAGLWSCGVVLMFGRVARQLLVVRRLLTPSGTFDSGLLADLQSAVDELTARLKLRFPVRLVVCDRVSVPGVIGTFWPVLLLPPAMLSGVPIEQLRIVIAHELAHARRFDFLVNLGQLIVESLLFFNPAVWWLSRQIRIEREACCDAAAVAATGSPVPVARTLLAVVERLRESLDTTTADRFAAAAGIQSFADDNSEGDNSPLFDRVRRIVTPELRPHVRVPWYTLLGVVAAYGLVSFGLYEGTAVTVHAVQQALSPKERVEKIEELVAAKGELARREGVPQTPPESEPGALFPEPVTVSGTVRTADGQPLPRLSVQGNLRGSGYSGAQLFGNFDPSDKPTSVFHFQGTTRGEKNIRGDTATLRLNVGVAPDSEAAKRYASVGVGPFEVRSGQKLENIELILEPGFDGQLRVLTSEGSPISNAFVAGHFSVDGTGAMLNQTFTRTNADGLTTIPLSTSRLQWHAHVRASGFQKQRFNLNLEKRQPIEVRLKPAHRTTLTLLSSVDGLPVTGARAFITNETQTSAGGGTRGYGLRDPRDQFANSYESHDAPLFAFGPSDEAGQLVLDSLSDGVKYDVLVMAPGSGPKIITEVASGTSHLKVELPPALTVSGKIVGDLSKLGPNWRAMKKFVRYRNVISAMTDTIQRSIIEIDGEVGKFQIGPLSPGRLEVYFPGQTLRRELTDSISGIVIDLDEPEPEVAPQLSRRNQSLPIPDGEVRKVVLTLTNTSPGVPIAGKFRAGYLTRKEPDSYSSAELDIVDSKVEFDVEVPTKIHWVDRSFTGYSVVGRTGVEVGTGDEPFRLDIPLLPGGAVRGEVRLADGSLCRNFKVDLRSVDRKSKYRGAEEDVNPVDPPGEFVLTGVPFGQKFRLLVTDERIRSVAAIVSEPFSLSAAEPIADLKFRFDESRTHVIRLLDEDGQPAIGAQAEFAFNPGLGFVRSHGWKVNDDATVVFEHVSDSIPGEATFQIEAAGPFRGQKLKLDWSNLPETLTLRRGVAASGRLVDEATGRGVAGARFFLFPTPSKAAEFRDAVWGETDDEGRFSFECLEPITYQLNLHGAVPPRVPFKENARGVLEPDYSGISDGTFPEWLVKGGSSEPVSIKVKLTPRSRLKLAGPESGN